MKISYLAPSKVILSGEHAVVYGRPALVCAINLRLKFTLKKKSLKEGNYQSGQNRFIDKNVKLAENLTREFLNKKFKKNPPLSFSFEYQINSKIPIGRGLGSSAAFSCALSAAFLEFFSKKPFEKPIINELAYELEKHFHKHPSGVDNSASCFGGIIYFRKEFDFLKTINHLPFKFPSRIERRLFLIDSGKPKETTADMVDWVKKISSSKKEKIFLQMEKVTKRMVISIKENNDEELEKAIFENERLLEKLNVVSKKTISLLKNLHQFGIGKITGAGGRSSGSGFVLFFAKNREKLIDFLKKQQIFYLPFKVDYQGLIRDGNNDKKN